MSCSHKGKKSQVIVEYFLGCAESTAINSEQASIKVMSSRD